MKRLLILMGLFGLLTGITWGQTHFQTVYSGNPYLAMNIYVTSAVIEDVALTAGDEIGIFDGEYCVGAAVVEGDIDPYLAMVAATDEAGTPEVDGFTPGNAIIFKIWDSENDMEITDVAATYALGDGTFASQGSAMVDLVGSLPEDHFTPVYFGNPYLAMNFYITAASIDDVELGAGDEIGIFDGDVCVGAGVLSAPIGDYVALVAATDDPGTPEIDGFTPGHTISYRLWDAGQELEIENVEAVYALGDGIFASQGSAMADLIGSTSVSGPVVVSPLADLTLPEDNPVMDIADLDTVFEDLDPEETLAYSVSNTESAVQVTIGEGALLQLELTADWFGEDVIVVTATNSVMESISDEFTLTVTPVNDPPQAFPLISPENGASLSTLSPAFSWQAASDIDPDDVVTYRLYLSTDPENYLQVYAGSETSWTPTEPLEDNSTYHWLVSAVDMAGDTVANTGGSRHFFLNLENESPQPFDLISPENDAMLSTLQPQFLWHPAPDIDPDDVLTYRLYLGTTIEDFARVYEGTDTTWTPAESLLDNSSYYWMVSAVDPSGDTVENIDGASHFYLNAENEAPSVVELVTPTDNSVEVVLTPEFYWEAATDPDPGDTLMYDLLIAVDTVMTDPQIITTPDHEWILETPLMDNGEYYWQVITRDLAGLETASEVYRFWTNTELEPPNPFELLSPPDMAQGLTTTPAFIWETATDNDPRDYAVYTLMVAEDSAFVSIVLTAEALTDTVFTPSEGLSENTRYWWKIIAMDTDSLTTESPVQTFTVGYVATEPEAAIPTKFALHTNYPNPFNPTTTIRYDLPEPSQVRLTIYNQLGQPIRTLVHGEKSAGFQSVVWDGRNNVGQQAGTGIYFYQINSGKFNQTRKMILLK
ncbi:MAG: T9SS type A sorting domain-containing protein [Lentisphaeria bacterium]|nr:T9SS type A sorting domain-containing protein [Candidatus Neomarinimicrobiota bacterium]MCF7841948.1 T9SS type A sorting domain-containing protein [Lentisphaeria bacterium]